MGGPSSTSPFLRRADGVPPSLATLLLLATAACTSTSPPVPGPPVDADGSPALPKLVRFVSKAEGTEDRTCFGQVLAAEDGVPTEVQLLWADGRPLCASAGTAELDTARKQLKAAVAQLTERPAAGGPPPETITDRERIKAPVPVEKAWIEDGSIVVSGIGINYALHAQQTGQTEPVAFNKLTVPEGPYRNVAQVERLPWALASRSACSTMR